MSSISAVTTTTTSSSPALPGLRESRDPMTRVAAPVGLDGAELRKALDDRPGQTRDEPGGEPKGESAYQHDDAKLSRISDLLEMDATEVTERATSASSLISMLQSRNVDLSRLRTVLDSGDLLDVSA